MTTNYFIIGYCNLFIYVTSISPLTFAYTVKYNSIRFLSYGFISSGPEDSTNNIFNRYVQYYFKLSSNKAYYSPFPMSLIKASFGLMFFIVNIEIKTFHFYFEKIFSDACPLFTHFASWCCVAKLSIFLFLVKTIVDTFWIVVAFAIIIGVTYAVRCVQYEQKHHTSILRKAISFYFENEGPEGKHSFKIYTNGSLPGFLSLPSFSSGRRLVS